jgi:hypothetical protein
MALGHRAVPVLALCIVGVVALNFRPPPADLGYAGASIGLLLVVLVTFGALRQHDRALCESCMGRFPLNPAEYAARFHRRFWLVHQTSRLPLVVAYLAAIAGSNLLTDLVGRIVWAVLTLSLIYPLLAYDAHRRFQPWCPWCDEGDGRHDHSDGHGPRLPDLLTS